MISPIAPRRLRRASFRISEAGRAHLRRRNAAAGGEPAYLAQQRHAIEVEISIEGERVRVRMNAEESPLDWLRRRKDRHGEALVAEPDHQAASVSSRPHAGGMLRAYGALGWARGEDAADPARRATRRRDRCGARGAAARQQGAQGDRATSPTCSSTSADF